MSRTKKFNFESKVIEIRVKPGSGRSEIVFDAQKKEYVFYVKAQAEDGKANDEVLKIIRKESGKEGKIISGATSRKKLIRLE